MRSAIVTWAVVLFGLMSFAGEAAAQSRQSTKRAGDATGGFGLFFGGGFPLDRSEDEPSLFRIGPRGWLWLGGDDRLKLGLSLPFAVGVGERRAGRSLVRSTTLYEIAPSAKAALQLGDLVRPYAEFGMGAAIVTRRVTFSPFGETSDTQGSLLIRTVVGAELTPRRKAEGLVVTVELMGLHARAFGFDGVDLVVLMGVGYEL